MTILQALKKYKSLRQNQNYDEDQLVGWLSELDGKVYNEIINTHDDGENITYSPYDRFNDDYNANKVLIIPEPYSQVYLLYLISQADLFNTDTARYANSSIAFNDKYKDFKNYYNGIHSMKTRYNIKYEVYEDEIIQPL
jgi:hypothetical protein